MKLFVTKRDFQPERWLAFPHLTGDIITTSAHDPSLRVPPPQENKGFFKGMMVVDKPLIRHNKAIRPYFLGVVTWEEGIR